ncbi:MAG: hypothetical protein KME16_28420 [Scytolyngbya sp. HA4215-MV1]|jgi:hypothetical protein|nr:hypothetical protein [Scytolyngbya sp. HA4215-MV1]
MTSQNQAVAMADALTLLLHQQHGIAAAVEELAKWVASQGGDVAADIALVALEGLDLHSQALIDAINAVRVG